MKTLQEWKAERGDEKLNYEPNNPDGIEYSQKQARPYQRECKYKFTAPNGKVGESTVWCRPSEFGALLQAWSRGGWQYEAIDTPHIGDEPVSPYIDRKNVFKSDLKDKKIMRRDGKMICPHCAGEIEL